MGYLRKTLERRTFSQDRYYILIKRQKAGTATFNELTELDEIVNRVPDLREKVILENFMIDDQTGTQNPPDPTDDINTAQKKSSNFWKRIRSFIQRLFIVHITTTEQNSTIELV